MHIALVRTVFDKAHGGAERYAVELARTWLHQGHQLSIVCQHHAAADADGMKVVPVSRPKALGPWKHRWFAKRAGEAARASGAEAVLCLARAFPGDVLRLGDGLHRSWLGARYPDLAQRKRALLNPRQRALLNLERELFLPGRFQLYVANSAMVRRAAIHMYGVEPGRVRVIPNGVDATLDHATLHRDRAIFRARNGVPADAEVLLFAGMDFRRKGLIEAARGFARLCETRDGVHFVCVGPGDTGEASAMLDAAGLHARSHFFPTSREMAQWYHTADVFVLPTMHDPSANAVTEALACGTPVITSSENGARQHIVNGENGWVLNNRADADEFAARATDLLHNPRDRQQVAKAAQLISRDDNAARMLQALTDAAQMRQKAPPALHNVRDATTRTEALRRLKRQLWAQGEPRDYREEFRKLKGKEPRA